ERIGGASGRGLGTRDERRAAVALLGVGGDKVDRQKVGRRKAERSAQAEVVERIELFLLRGVEVLDIAIALLPFESETARHHIVAGIEEAGEHGGVEVAVAAGHCSR